MDLFKSLPLKKQEYMNRLFRNCTEEVKYYMSVIDVEADQTFIKAGEECKYIYIILSGKVTGVEWPMHEKSYFFKDFGPGDFFGEIECFQQNVGCLPSHLFIIWSGCIWMLMHCS